MNIRKLWPEDMADTRPHWLLPNDLFPRDSVLKMSFTTHRLSIGMTNGSFGERVGHGIVNAPAILHLNLHREWFAAVGASVFRQSRSQRATAITDSGKFCNCYPARKS